MSRIAGAVLAATLVSVPAWPQALAVPQGWYKAGNNPSEYDVGVDRTVKHGGDASAFVKSRASDAAGFGTLMQTITADRWRGKRVRLAGHLRTAAVDKSAGLWMRIDGPDRSRPLGFDNMDNRGLHGTVDWTAVQIVLDVAPDAVEISFGIMLRGTGHVWADDLTFEAVTNRTPTTGAGSRFPSAPVNLDFERRPGG